MLLIIFSYIIMTDSCSIVSIKDLREKYPKMGKLLQKLSPGSPILRDINNRIDSSPDAAKIKAMIKNAEQTPCSQAGGAQQKRGKDTGSGRNWRGNVGQFVTIMIALCVALLSIRAVFCMANYIWYGYYEWLLYRTGSCIGNDCGICPS